MDTLNATVIGTHATSSLSTYHHRWSTLSPALMSENDDDTNEVCGPMKIEHPFDNNGQAYFRNNSSCTASVQQSQRRQPTESSSSSSPSSASATAAVTPTTIPLASCATAAASLSSAFNKRSGTTNKTALLVNERQFQNGLTNNAISNTPIKTEQNSRTGENPNCYSTATQPSSTTETATVPSASGISSDDSTSNEMPATPASSAASNNTNDAAQMDIYRDLILRHLIQDINTTCTKLGLPTDPQAWSAEHSARWISEMCVQFQLPPPRQLYMNGRTLLSMSQDDFMVRAPEGGDTLHAQLQLWKTAYDSYSQQNNNNNSNNNNNNQGNSQVAQNCTRPSPYWMSPAPLALNVAEQGERLTSAQDYLNNFNPSNNEAAINMSCYAPSNTGTYQNIAQEGALLGNASAQQQYYTSVQVAGIGILPSPSNSEISSNDSSVNDVNTIDGSVIDARQTGTPQFPRHSGTVHLWHFIRELLDHPKQYSSCVRWVDRQEGTFKIESSHHLARFWGQRKNRAQMNYDKLSRSLRQYYKKGIIQKPEKKQRLVYKFLPPYNL